MTRSDRVDFILQQNNCVFSFLSFLWVITMDKNQIQCSVWGIHRTTTRVVHLQSGVVKKPKDLSTCDREDRGCGEGVCVGKNLEQL